MQLTLSSVRSLRAAVLSLLAVTAACGVATAQTGPAIGNIPGTSMSRDEFTARAEAQLAVLALDAVAYLLAGDGYNKDYYDLMASPAGNLGLKNMFTGRPVQAIFFEPGPDALINSPMAGIPEILENMSTAPRAPTSGPLPPINPETGSSEWTMTRPGAAPAPLRVDAAEIRDFSGGDVYMYVRDEMLQLVLFAPDGTFVERIDEVPSANFRENLRTAVGAAPEGLYLLQVLYYLGNLAPQYSNLVRYMSNQETIPGATFPNLSPQQRLAMSDEVGITVRNPVSRRPIKLSVEPSPGDIVDPSVSGGILKLWDSTGKAVNRAELSSGSSARQAGGQRDKPARPGKPKAGSKPGKGGGAAPGGGRKPR